MMLGGQGVGWRRGALALVVLVALAQVGCALSREEPGGRNLVEVTVQAQTSEIPWDGECASISLTRLEDAAVTTYEGLLAEAKIKVETGAYHLTGSAFPQPCAQRPEEPPWVLDPQVITVVPGKNTVPVNLRRNAKVELQPTFHEDEAAMLAERPGSRVRTGRSGEDTAAPHFALDGWWVSQIDVPPPGGGPGPFGETPLFRVGEGLSYTPRGMAVLPGDTFVFQVGEPAAPLAAYDGAGTFLGQWPVVYPEGLVVGDFTDGLEGVGADHLVRTWWLSAPQGCEAPGPDCVQSGIEILERKIAPDASVSLEVVEQIPLAAPYNQTYAVGVAPLAAGGYVVSLIPDTGGTLLISIDGTGAVIAGPTTLAGDVEGLFATSDGRVIGLDYAGSLATYDASDLAPRPGEEADYSVGIGIINSASLAWSEGDGGYLALTTFPSPTVFLVTPAFDAATPLPVDFSGISFPLGLAVKPGTAEVALMDQRPPVDPATGERIPVVQLYDRTTGAPTSAIMLQGLPLPIRPRHFDFIGSTDQIVSHHRLPGTPPDPLNAMAFVHWLDGSLAYAIDLGPAGVERIISVSWAAASDELLFLVLDLAGAPRLVVTDLAGAWRRSYPTADVGPPSDLAPVSSGPDAGDVGAILAQPGEFFRLAPP